ncbi:MAG: hexose kinase [Acidobacteria bacterium]|nr:hexose kinase [Acidobacteriota bacterium]
MILCISANPAIDRRLRIERLQTGGVNRASSVVAAPGGKAAHVAMAARALGEAVQWIGFSGGTTGAACVRGLEALSIPVIPVRTRSATRINLEIIDDRHTVTEILEPGGAVTAAECNEMLRVCYESFAQHRQQAVIVLSGSLPPGAPPYLYAQLIQMAHQCECRTMIDTSGDAFGNALAAQPSFVKPNREEAAAFSGFAITDAKAALVAARQCLARGAASAAVTLGRAGLIWLQGQAATPLVASSIDVAARSTVGCGDATLAAFAVAAVRGLDTAETLRLAVASAAANCLADLPGQIQKSEVARLLPLVKCDELEPH